MGHADHGADDGGIVGTGSDVGDETAVDFQSPDRQSLQIAQRRVAGAEIVECQTDVQGRQIAQGTNDRVGVGQNDALGDFQLQAAGWQLRVVQGATGLAVDVGLVELASGQVDGNPGHRQPFVQPTLGGATGFGQHPFADFADEAGFFQHADEFARQHQSVLRPSPAQQRLGADYPAAAQVDLRLIVEFELVLGHRLT